MLVRYLRENSADYLQALVDGLEELRVSYIRAVSKLLELLEDDRELEIFQTDSKDDLPLKFRI